MCGVIITRKQFYEKIKKKFIILYIFILRMRKDIKIVVLARNVETQKRKQNTRNVH